MRIVVVGGTSEIAQQCCRIWLSDNSIELVLTGRNENKLARLVTDLKIRFPKSKIEHQAFNHLSPMAIDAFVKQISKERLDLVLIAHGSLTSQSRAKENSGYLWKELETNASSPILFSELFAGALEGQGYGKLAVIGSVAGDRGRAINHAYGAAKASLATYISGLQHRLAKTSIKISLIKPGPTLTPMTINAHVGPSKLADPVSVAKKIVKGISKGRRVIYAPSVWRYIMFAVRVTPFWLFKRIGY